MIEGLYLKSGLLRFRDPFEAQYRTESLASARNQIRASTLLFCVCALALLGLVQHFELTFGSSLQLILPLSAALALSLGNLGLTFWDSYWKVYPRVLPAGIVLHHLLLAVATLNAPTTWWLVAFPGILMVFVLAQGANLTFHSIVAAQTGTFLVWGTTVLYRGEYLSATGRPVAMLFYLGCSYLISIVLAYSREKASRRDFVQRLALAAEQRRSESLLRQLMPERVATRIKNGETAIADYHGEATVLFADLAGFTSLAANTSPANLVALLDDLFSRFDENSERFGLERLKTIGDSYMAVAGLEDPNASHAERAVDCALALTRIAAEVGAAHGLELSLRVGLSSGAVVAGVVGKHNLAYDVWGDTVNVAARMESHGTVGRVQISESTYAKIGSHFDCEPAGSKTFKGKGMLNAWYVNGRRGEGMRAA